MTDPSILVVEDEEDIQQLVTYNLVKAGFGVRCADTGGQGLAMVREKRPDIIILDLMLPDIDGLQFCGIIRNDEATRMIPVIMLTAKGEERDIVAGLNMGADDYITKPFSPRVLIARVQSVLRRISPRDDAEPEQQPEHIAIRNLEIQPGRHEVLVDSRPVTLTATEFDILLVLARRPGWVFSRQQIIDSIRGHLYQVTERIVDVQIFNLRKKLGPAGDLVETVRGRGYRLKE